MGALADGRTDVVTMYLGFSLSFLLGLAVRDCLLAVPFAGMHFQQGINKNYNKKAMCNMKFINMN